MTAGHKTKRFWAARRFTACRRLLCGSLWMAAQAVIGSPRVTPRACARAAALRVSSTLPPPRPTGVLRVSYDPKCGGSPALIQRRCQALPASTSCCCKTCNYCNNASTVGSGVAPLARYATWAEPWHGARFLRLSSTYSHYHAIHHH